MTAFVRLTALAQARWLIFGVVAALVGDTGAGCGGAATQISTVVRSTTFTTQQGYGPISQVACQPGEVATGGGYRLVGGIPIGRIPTPIISEPIGPGDTSSGWQVRWYWSPGGEQLEVYVVCGKLQ